MWVWLYIWTDEVSRCKLGSLPVCGQTCTCTEEVMLQQLCILHVCWWHHSTQQQQTREQNRVAEKINFEPGEINFKPGDSRACKTCREGGVVYNNADITWRTIEISIHNTKIFSSKTRCAVLIAALWLSAWWCSRDQCAYLVSVWSQTEQTGWENSPDSSNAWHIYIYTCTEEHMYSGIKGYTCEVRISHASVRKERAKLWKYTKTYMHAPWRSLQKTSFPTSQRRCGGIHPFLRRQGHCACLQHVCTSESCRLSSASPCHCQDRLCPGRWVWTAEEREMYM